MKDQADLISTGSSHKAGLLGLGGKQRQLGSANADLILVGLKAGLSEGCVQLHLLLAHSP